VCQDVFRLNVFRLKSAHMSHLSSVDSLRSLFTPPFALNKSHYLIIMWYSYPIHNKYLGFLNLDKLKLKLQQLLLIEGSTRLTEQCYQFVIYVSYELDDMIFSILQRGNVNTHES
jgi:hypothetical protein